MRQGETAQRNRWAQHKNLNRDLVSIQTKQTGTIESACGQNMGPRLAENMGNSDQEAITDNPAGVSDLQSVNDSNFPDEVSNCQIQSQIEEEDDDHGPVNIT